MAKSVRSDKTAKRHDERRKRILKAARALFAAGGVEALNMRAIGTRAGMPAMTLYSYFPSKMAIMHALWSDAFAPLLQELNAAETLETRPKERLRKVAQTFVDYWMSHRDLYRIVFLTEDQREHEGDQWFIEESDVVPAMLKFGPLIAKARGDKNGDYTHEGEALLLSLCGIVHLLMSLSEYPWAGSATYVNMMVDAFSRRQV